jgi:hypothetical protein
MRPFIIVLSIWLLIAGCKRSETDANQPNPEAAAAVKKAQADKAKSDAARAEAANAEAARQKDMDFLMTNDWMAAEATDNHFLDLGVSVRFSPDGKMTDWRRMKDLGTFRIDPTQNPRQIDLMINGQTRPCVYETVDGERPEIRICLPLHQQDPRPESAQDPWKDLSKAGKERSKRIAFVRLQRVVKQTQ